MQRAEHQVPGFSSADRQLNGFQIAHFSHQDHVGVLSQGRSQCIGETAGVFIELALMHQALIALVNEFDRILDREDVFRAAVVDVIQQCRQGGGFA